MSVSLLTKGMRRPNNREGCYSGNVLDLYSEFRSGY